MKIFFGHTKAEKKLFTSRSILLGWSKSNCGLKGYNNCKNCQLLLNQPNNKGLSKGIPQVEGNDTTGKYGSTKVTEQRLVANKLSQSA